MSFIKTWCYRGNIKTFSSPKAFPEEKKKVRKQKYVRAIDISQNPADTTDSWLKQNSSVE